MTDNSYIRVSFNDPVTLHWEVEDNPPTKTLTWASQETNDTALFTYTSETGTIKVNADGVYQIFFYTKANSVSDSVNVTAAVNGVIGSVDERSPLTAGDVFNIVDVQEIAADTTLSIQITLASPQLYEAELSEVTRWGLILLQH